MYLRRGGGGGGGGGTKANVIVFVESENTSAISLGTRESET